MKRSTDLLVGEAEDVRRGCRRFLVVGCECSAGALSPEGKTAFHFICEFCAPPARLSKAEFEACEVRRVVCYLVAHDRPELPAGVTVKPPLLRVYIEGAVSGEDVLRGVE